LDLANFDEIKNKTKAEKKNNNFKLLFVGGLGKRKGVFDLLEISKKLKEHHFNFVLYLAGGEEEAGSLKKIQNIAPTVE